MGEYLDKSGAQQLWDKTKDLVAESSNLDAVPTTRTINGNALSSDITLTAEDVGAVPTTRTINGKALSNDITLTMDDIGASNLALAAYPVGSIYMSIMNTNPGTLFGGVWRAFAPGRVLVGVNSSDSDFSQSGKMGGSKTHRLTVSQIPAHTHPQTLYWSAESGDSNVVSPALETNDPREYSTYPVTGAAGDGQPHNNLQPYITCYMWRRTA